MSFLVALVALVAVNAPAFLAFAIDKRSAERGEWRIRESTLLGLAALGGSPAAIWARRRFRHKTRKQPFSAKLDGIAVLHAGIVLGLAGAFL